MAYIIGESYRAIRDILFNDDPENMERVGSIHFPLSVVLLYLLFVKWLGPLLMKPFKPLRLNSLLIAFNISIVVWNAYVSFNIANIIYDSAKNGKLCNLMTNEVNMKYYVNKAYKFVWLFYISKYVDLLDTIFFVLRKKHRQISFLHVFHHSTVILLIWWGIRYKCRGGYIGVGISLNSFVHVCTYTYYALSACGPKIQRYTYPRKIYLTFVQVIQFWIVLGYIAWGLISGCEHLDKGAGTSVIFFSILMILFANFYVKNYKKKQ
ncbi:very long chain fatty acid elongase 4 [Parasteatoda tepidariorum]|nr:elongation of very long chain fatty acids protein 4 [Parasteatoda tepidariorum]XP_042901528.1 elongation of very long chain fatty acids protein 4 [Parasteatoda tepidariorum]